MSGEEIGRHLLITIISLLILISQFEVSRASAGTRIIDLYTQKEPYIGKGLDQPSDAFAPREEIFLYANVTYQGYPVSGKIVAFEIESSLGLWDLGTAVTDEDGVATWSSRLPNETHMDLFGVWHVYATVDIAEETIMDTLTFRFGYIIEIVSLMTVNEDLQPQKNFTRSSCVGVKLALRSIAMMNKTATLTVIAYDNQGTPLLEKVIFEEFVLRPNETYFYLHCVLEIPEWAALGEALLIASAFTAPPAEGGVPWCPGVSTSFLITWCDVAVISVVPSVEEVEVGGLVEVSVDVVNEGYKVESFNVSLYYDSFLISVCNMTALAPGERKTLVFVWNTSGVAVGDYRLKAVASMVPGETDVEDNVFEDCVVHVVEAGVFVSATIDIDSDTLNLKSKGKWITAYIELPEGYDVNEINVSTILLDNTILAESHPTEIGDYDNDTIPDLMVKFNRTTVRKYILGHYEFTDRFGEVTLTITGQLKDGRPFEGRCIIRVVASTNPVSPRPRDIFKLPY